MSVAGHPTFTCGTSADIYVWQFTCGTSLRLRRAWESLETFATPPTPIATALGRATLLAHPSPILTHTHSYSLILTHTHSYSLVLTRTTRTTRTTRVSQAVLHPLKPIQFAWLDQTARSVLFGRPYLSG